MQGAILRFEVRPEHRATFVDALREHGRIAATTEPKTLRFDVIADQGDPNRIFLYEAYADTDAFAAHLQGESHRQFVRVMSENDWLTESLTGPPRPFAPFIVGIGQSEFAIEDARS